MITRSTRRRRIATVAGAILLFALVGEAGHLILTRAGHEHHHVFHVAYPVAATLLFFSLVAARARRAGGLSFSWRLDPGAPHRR